MSEAPPLPKYDVTCPHCRKQFRGGLLAGAQPRLRGFKCPHCRLFVPFAHATAPDGATADA